MTLLIKSEDLAGLISVEDYRRDVRHAEMFLEGRSSAVIDELAAAMEQASANLDFERAASLRDQIRRLERHPAVFTWLDGSDFPPPPKIEKMYLRILAECDWPNPTVSSASSKATTVGASGVKMTGPYEYVPPSFWYLDTERGGAWGFNTETSPGPAIPPIEAGGYPGTLLAERSLPGSIMVDSTGKRFMNEAVNYMTAGQIMLGQDDGLPPHVPAWIIFDQAFRNRYVFGTGVMPRMPLPKAWYKAGLAHRGATVAALGEQVGLPGLATAVERFNLMAAQGHDDDFGRGNSMYDRYYGDPAVTPNPNLAPLLKPPFYAVKVIPGDLGTCGGIRADEFARATRPDGSVIDGLYATGNCAGNAVGSYYPGPGATIGQGLTFAYIAAAHAAGKLS